MKKLMLFMLLTSCTYYTPPVDTKEAVWVHKSPPPANIDTVLEVIRENLPCKLRNDAWSGSITWVEGPINCEGVRAAGCWDGIVAFGAPIFRISKGPMFATAADTATVHELGHYGFLRCDKQTQPNFKECAKKKIAVEDCPHPQDFLEWVEATKAKARARIPVASPSER